MPLAGIIFTNVVRRAVKLVAFYCKRGSRIKEGKGAIRWIPLSSRSSSALRLQCHLLASARPSPGLPRTVRRAGLSSELARIEHLV